MIFDSAVEELQKRMSRLEKERGCTVDNKESYTVCNKFESKLAQDKTNDSRDSPEHQRRIA